MTDLELLASKLYTAYCFRVGGKAFNNDPLPDWDSFVKDPLKQKQMAAWLAVAAEAESHFCGKVQPLFPTPYFANVVKADKHEHWKRATTDRVCAALSAVFRGFQYEPIDDDLLSRLNPALSNAVALAVHDPSCPFEVDLGITASKDVDGFVLSFKGQEWLVQALAAGVPRWITGKVELSDSEVNRLGKIGRTYDTGLDTWRHNDYLSKVDDCVALGPCPHCGSKTRQFINSWVCMAECAGYQSVKHLLDPTGFDTCPTWWNSAITVKKDGDQWCAHYDDFVDLETSPAGFGATPQDAVVALDNIVRES